MDNYGIKIGDKVQCGVYVLGEWKPTSPGIVVSQTSDGSVSGVDVMSLHGGAPWVRQEATSQLRRAETPNVRAKRATTAGRQARGGEDVQRTTDPGLVACRWRSA